MITTPAEMGEMGDGHMIQSPWVKSIARIVGLQFPFPLAVEGVEIEFMGLH